MADFQGFFEQKPVFLSELQVGCDFFCLPIEGGRVAMPCSPNRGVPFRVGFAMAWQGV